MNNIDLNTTETISAQQMELIALQMNALEPSASHIATHNYDMFLMLTNITMFTLTAVILVLITPYILKSTSVLNSKLFKKIRLKALS